MFWSLIYSGRDAIPAIAAATIETEDETMALLSKAKPLIVKFKGEGLPVSPNDTRIRRPGQYAPVHGAVATAGVRQLIAEGRLEVVDEVPPGVTPVAITDDDFRQPQPLKPSAFLVYDGVLQRADWTDRQFAAAKRCGFPAPCGFTTKTHALFASASSVPHWSLKAIEAWEEDLRSLNL